MSSLRDGSRSLPPTLGLSPNPAAVQQLEVAFDVVDVEAVVAFWRSALGYVQVAPHILVEPNLSGPAFSFHSKQAARGAQPHPPRPVGAA